MIDLKEASVIFVDDEDEILDLLQREFSSTIGKVFVANNSTLAIKLVKENNIDVAVLDLRMPDKNGLELCRELKPIAPKMRYIFLTGNSDRQSVQDAMRLGVDNFIDKPFVADFLRLSVISAVEKARYSQLITEVLELFIQNYTKLDFSKFHLLSESEQNKILHSALSIARLQMTKKEIGKNSTHTE